MTPEEAEKDGKLMELVREQTDQWTQLMNAQRRARWDLTKADKQLNDFPVVAFEIKENKILKAAEYGK